MVMSAWGFTNAYVDISDLVVVEMAPNLDSWYTVPGRSDSVKIEQRTETIEVKGSHAVTVEYPWTIWGPIIGKNERGRPLALRWVAHDPTATNLGLLAMEDATDVASAVTIAHHAGMPASKYRDRRYRRRYCVDHCRAPAKTHRLRRSIAHVMGIWRPPVGWIVTAR